MIVLSELEITGLDILLQIYENICLNLKAEISKLDNSLPEHKEKTEHLAMKELERELILAEIKRRQATTMVFSVEDIYKFSGQEDKYSIFRFYRTSEAYKKYGSEVYGYITYRKKERENLEQKVSKENYERTDGRVLIDAASQNEITTKLLLEEGFLASEVAQLYNMNHHDNRGKQYKKEGTKNIPNTININITPSGDNDKMMLYLSGRRLDDGYTLLPYELIKYYSTLYVLHPEAITEEIKAKYLLDEKQQRFNEEADFKIHEVKVGRQLASADEKNYFASLIRNRRNARFDIVKRELGIQGKHLAEFGQNNIDAFAELFTTVNTFSTETLSYYKTAYPVYWDFERFAHIYLRHYKNFFISSTTARGTHFQYTHKDIRQLAKLVIESLKDEIEEALANGKPYAKYGDQGYYFNGNYYTIRVAPDGKLMQFHPQE